MTALGFSNGTVAACRVLLTEPEALTAGLR
jgi:predicted esterase